MVRSCAQPVLSTKFLVLRQAWKRACVPEGLVHFLQHCSLFPKLCLDTSAPTVLMPYVDGPQGFTSGKTFSTGPSSGSELGLALAKNSLYWKVWLPMAERVLVVHGGS